MALLQGAEGGVKMGLMSTPQSPSEQTPPAAETVKHCAKHPAVETRLSCSSCETPICPKCMVMCDVGIKCPACVNKTSSHMLQVGKKHLFAGGIGGFAGGVLFGYLYPFLGFLPFSFFGIPVLSLLVSFAIGRGVGEGIQKFGGRKMGPTMAGVVTVTAIVGLLAGPYHFVVLGFMEILQSAQNIQGNMGTSASFYGFRFFIDIALAYVFITGLRGAFLFK